MSVQYLTLIASLPPHVPQLFKNLQTPISRLKLDERLNMLEPEDALDLNLIEKLMHWDHMAMDTTDADMIKRGEQVMTQLSNEFIKQEVCWRLELRTLIAALRRRQLQHPAPTPGTRWGYGRWLHRIENHWHEPAFRLERHYPWLPEANRLLQERDHFGLERLILELNWEYYGRMADDHYFDFEAVVLYVLRWDIIDRWSRYDSKKAKMRFDAMLDSALGKYRTMYV